MKAYNYLFAAAIVILSACSEETAQNETTVGKTVVFSAQTEDTKATIGTNENSKPQTFWENGDQITVFSDAAPSTAYTFTTSLGANATSADFSYTGSFETGTNYMAIYPASGVTADFSTSKLFGIVIPASQTLAADRIGKDYLFATAYSADGETLPFKNATSILMFQVADGRVVSGAIGTSEGEYIAGTFDAALSAEGVPTLSNTADGANQIEFTIDGSTKLSTETNYYVAIAPTTLAKGFSLKLQNAGGSYVEKTYSIPSLDRKKLYGVGNVTSNNNVSKIVLHFNFADGDAIDFSGWGARSGRSDDVTDGTFSLNGQAFVFKSAKKAEGTGSTWPSFGGTSDVENQLHFTQSACLGLPYISGYNLVTIVFDTEDSNNAQPLYFEGERLSAPTVDLSIGAVKNPDNLTFDVADRSAEMTEYWLYQAGGGSNAFDMSAITLTYVKK